MKRFRRCGLFIALVIALSSGPVFAASEADEDNKGQGPSGLPLPRFASLRADEVNLRTGPGTRYPIEWVFVRENLPVEITAEFDVWRRVRDWEGSEGWVHKSTLSGKRSAIVIGETRPLRKEPLDDAAMVAAVEPGSVGILDSCQKTWCKLKIGGYKGYMKKTDFWGAYENETFH